MLFGILWDFKAPYLNIISGGGLEIKGKRAIPGSSGHEIRNDSMISSIV